MTEREAVQISSLSCVIEHAPFDREGDSLTLQERWGTRIEERLRAANDFQSQLRRLANLDGNQMLQIMAFLDLIELPDLDGSQSNWALEFMKEVLYDVVRYGSAASALQQDPRGVLASLSHYMYNYWAWVRDSRDVVKQHPEIFPAPPAVPEAAATSTKPKRQRARKGGRKAA